MNIYPVPPTQRPFTILLVEDEPLLRSLLVDVLLEMNATVHAEQTADDGLITFQNLERVDLVITDVLTPGNLNGIELALAVHKQRPALPVIVTSGYTNEDLHRLPPTAQFLPKPYPLDIFCQTLEFYMKNLTSTSLSTQPSRPHNH